jgi:hypothetical protein
MEFYELLNEIIPISPHLCKIFRLRNTLGHFIFVPVMTFLM